MAPAFELGLGHVNPGGPDERRPGDPDATGVLADRRPDRELAGRVDGERATLVEDEEFLPRRHVWHGSIPWEDPGRPAANAKAQPTRPLSNTVGVT